ncbi:unnamed protein product [Rotaria sordida]|uniref:TRPM SLOG domain-containing protein n=1 Tax=Rotaria sordida TaxID=392033 RepID=A0A814BUM9_9BILA|nr:unnamed protein product [Rotaria sordida]
MNAPNIIVLAGIWSEGVNSPFFFRDTVTEHSHFEKLNRERVSAIEYQMNLAEIFYMHDGAPSHYAQSIRQFLDKKFPNRIQDFGNIIFAANEHHAKYARVPFVSDIDDKKTPVEERSSAKYFLDKPDDPHQTNRSFNDCTSSIPSQTQVAEYIVGLMRHGWKLPSPQLLISVTGGTGRYELPKRIQSAFQRGLMTAAVTTGTKLSDLARNVTSFDSPTNLLPIGTPIASEENRQNYKHSTTYETQNKVYRGRLTIDDVNNSPLDLNHTHFVLLDDMLGEVSEASNAEAPHRPDLAIKMRAEIEHQISKNYRISIVQILANGGPSSILTVCEALEQGTPIIVIADTNRAADLIIREYKYLYGDNSTDREARRSKEAYTKALPRCNDYYAYVSSCQ